MKKWFIGLACVGMMAVSAMGQYVVDFEGAGETKTAYASATVTLSGMQWDMTEALIGTTAGSDWFNGLRSARLRGYGISSLTMLEDLAGGVGTLSFSYRRYGTDAQVDWRVEYSTDGGTSWTQVGADFTAPASDDVQTFSESIHSSGNTRVRIKRATETGTANARLNIDDITMTSGGPATFGVTFDQADGFAIAEGAGAAITATAADGTEPYAYLWSSTLDPSYYNTNVPNIFFIELTAPLGTYTSTVVATDAALLSVTSAVSFTVVAVHPITLTPPVNGTVTTVPESGAVAGATVTITATPAVGYRVASVAVVDEALNPVGVSGAQPTYTFSMPDSAVTVTVAFEVFVGSDLIISEVADPSGTGGGDARFVELYNAGASSIDLAAGQWYLARQANGGVTWGNISLTGTVAAAGTYVVSYNLTNYTAAYPAAALPNQTSGTINGNGDDGYFLYSGGNSSNGVLQDAYGVLNQDGTGMPWEYEDARAARNADVTAGNPMWTASEWTITDPAVYADMTPGVHPDGLAVFGVTFNKASGFTVEEGTSDSVFATAANGVAPYTYGWTSSLEGTYFTADTNRFTILATAPIGDYSLEVVATDSDTPAKSVTNSLNFSVVAPPPKYAISIVTNAPAEGTVTTTPATEAAAGVAVTIQITPADGYRPATVVVNGGAVAVVGNVFTMPAEPATVTVTFEVYDAPDVLIDFETDTALSGSAYTAGTSLVNNVSFAHQRVLRGSLANDRVHGVYAGRFYPAGGTNALMATTAAFAEPITKISFWHANYGSDNGTTFQVQVSPDGATWADVGSVIDPESTTLTEVVLESIPANATYVQFVTVSGAVRINIDDIGLWFGAAPATLSYTGSPTGTVGQAMNLVFTLNGATASGWQYLLEGSGREELDTGSSNEFSFTPTFAGTYYLTMTALDEAVNPIATREVELTVNAAPVTDVYIPAITFLPASGNFTFAVPTGYTLGTVYGADAAVGALGNWTWTALVNPTDYTVSGGTITILSHSGGRKMIRIGLIPN